MKRFLTVPVVICFIAASISAQAQKLIQLASPDNSIKISIDLKDKIYYSVTCNNDVLLKDCYLQLTLENETLGQQPKLQKQRSFIINTEAVPVVPLKFSTVKDHCNGMLLSFKNNFAVEFRAYNDGIAYRFITNNKDSAYVMNEDFAINFPENYLVHLQQTPSFKTSYEYPYTHLSSNEFNEAGKMSTLPVLIDTRKEYKMLISESDLFDYPCMFLKGTNTNGMHSVFPKVPLEFGDDGDRSVKITKEADYIAKTAGKRNYPWRYIVITKNDGQLLENTMTFKLAPPNALQETSWIKPGQVSWEWWNDASPYGPDVNFVAGYNLETYKYYIDFASKYGIPYIIMDEGWAKSTRDPYTPNPKVDLHELIRYGKTKNVGVVLWLTWLTVENNFDLFKTFNEWGVKGVKIDFMDRSDQWMVNYYERVAKEAAKYNLFIDFHGAFKPAGLERKYPNILSYEGVLGLEQMGNCKPDNSIYFPFMRNAVGAMDFTPGAMINMQPNVYRAERPNAAGIGTRANQMSMFVIFESGLQMLADNPTLYYRNAECTDFIASVPVTWDETKALKCEVGEYVIVAKRKGNEWFIGGMTNSKERSIDVNLDFLTDGKTYEMTSFEDGINAGRQAMDYRKKVAQVKNGNKLTIKMVRNGGFAARLKPM